jgi:two-component system response regulator RegA
VDIDKIEHAFGVGKDAEFEATVQEEPPSLARHEREYIEYVLAECDGNISEAARRLGLHRQSLQRKLRKHTPC